ncbi:hypothetical protein PGTUg99_014730 [Puccinia graminis f. sp. tritici]|uniref:Uncharacterized protein n=1 Tax=Puccinia graminis f. sp. tritici TaxID=56615 RepID=A0A5B0MPZ1_PUCGR|nr:hypothetical protein PGTUg99_014730 [Puccinia graminis f. sp. tritici]
MLGTVLWRRIALVQKIENSHSSSASVPLDAMRYPAQVCVQLESTFQIIDLCREHTTKYKVLGSQVRRVDPGGPPFVYPASRDLAPPPPVARAPLL